MAQTLHTLLTSAAELRVVGHSWESIGKKLNRRPKTCRGWPARYPTLWQQLFREAQRRRFEQTAGECHTYLLNLIRDKDPGVQQKALDCWFKYAGKAYGPAGDPADGPGAGQPQTRAGKLFAPCTMLCDQQWDAMDRQRAGQGLPPLTDKEFVAESLKLQREGEAYQRAQAWFQADANGNSACDSKAQLVDPVQEPNRMDRDCTPKPTTPGSGATATGLVLALVALLAALLSDPVQQLAQGRRGPVAEGGRPTHVRLPAGQGLQHPHVRFEQADANVPRWRFGLRGEGRGGEGRPLDADHLAYTVQERRRPEGREVHRVRVAVEHAPEQAPLALDRLEHSLLDRPAGHEVHHPHRPALTHAVDAGDPLLQHRRVPRQLQIDHRVGPLQVQPDPAGVGAQEQPAVVRLEPLQDRPPLLPLHAAVQQRVPDPEPVEHLRRLVQHRLPLAEHYRLVVPGRHQVLDHLGELIQLRRHVRLLVEQERRVAHEAHVDDARQDPLAVEIRQHALAQEPRQVDLLLLVRPALGVGQLDVPGRVRPLRQLPEHLGPRAAQEDRGQLAPNLVEVPVPGQVPLGVLHPVLVQELVRRPEPPIVHELHDRVQLFQPVLQRRPGEDDRVPALQLLDGPRRLRLPVLDPLRLVEHNDVRPPGVHQVQVADHLFVVDQLVERVLRVQLLAGFLQSLDDLYGAVGELADLPLPLVLDRRRGHDQNAADPPLASEQLHGGNGLRGLPEPHVVAEDAPTAAGQKDRPACLEVVQGQFEQVPGRGVVARP